MGKKKLTWQETHRLDFVHDQIINLRLNVYPNCPNEEKPRLAHKISVLCDEYHSLKNKAGGKTGINNKMR